jgi:hypothetical protein
MNWHLSSGGEFSIESAYGLQRSSLDAHRDKDFMETHMALERYREGESLSVDCCT